MLGGGHQVSIGNGGASGIGPRFFLSESRALDGDTWQVSITALSEFTGNGNQDEANGHGAGHLQRLTDELGKSSKREAFGPPASRLSEER